MLTRISAKPWSSGLGQRTTASPSMVVTTYGFLLTGQTISLPGNFPCCSNFDMCQRLLMHWLVCASVEYVPYLIGFSSFVKAEINLGACMAIIEMQTQRIIHRRTTPTLLFIIRFNFEISTSSGTYCSASSISSCP